jgi:carboxyl-terminal processing protease
MFKRILFLLLSGVLILPLSAQHFDRTLNEKLMIVGSAIDRLYVDSVDMNKIVETGIIHMLKELDPHSTYSTPKEVKSMMESLEGEFDGIGITFEIVKDTLCVVQTVPDGPSEKAGLLAGDRIIYVNDTLVANTKLTNSRVTKLLRGPKGTKVKVKIERQGTQELLSFTIIRDHIPINSISIAYMIRPTVGYVHIDRFGANTAKELHEALKTLKKEGMEQLILDLQYNGGGYLSAAIGVASEFLEGKEKIVYTQGLHTQSSTYNASKGGLFTQGNIYVLINEYSASASEIVSGALQDWDRGTIIGRRSFGKGLVQRPISLPDKSMIRLTTARYYTPSGRCIQKPYKNQEEYQNDIENRLKSGELTNKDSIHFADSLKYTTLIKKRTVYGGGGIMPDYFVPLDTTRAKPYLLELRNKNIMRRLGLQLVDKHRKEWKEKYPTPESFVKNFKVTDELLKALIALAKDEKIKFNAKEYNSSKPIIELQIKGAVARHLWNFATYLRVMNQRDDIIQKALSLIDEQLKK